MLRFEFILAASIAVLSPVVLTGCKNSDAKTLEIKCNGKDFTITSEGENLEAAQTECKYYFVYNSENDTWQTGPTSDANFAKTDSKTIKTDSNIKIKAGSHGTGLDVTTSGVLVVSGNVSMLTLSSGKAAGLFISSKAVKGNLAITKFEPAKAVKLADKAEKDAFEKTNDDNKKLLATAVKIDSLAEVDTKTAASKSKDVKKEQTGKIG